MIPLRWHHQTTHVIGRTQRELCVNNKPLGGPILTTVTTVVLFNPYKTIQES